jgi:hypothetical protein
MSLNNLPIFVSKFSGLGLVTIILVSSAYKRILESMGARFGKFVYINQEKK